MGFTGGGASGGFISGGGQANSFKAKIMKVLNATQNSFTLSGVVATDIISIHDHFGIPWEEGDHYTRTGDDLNVIGFLSPMIATVTFTIYVYEPSV